MNSVSVPNPKANRKPRFGCIKVQIGSNHVIKGPDGVKRQFKVKDKSRLPKETKLVAVCLTCNKTFKTVDELLQLHPEEQILRKQEETHPYCWWSDTAQDKDQPESPTNIVGLISDIERENA